jgi:pyrroloquinoline quinone (PQQ) biosynthesis protein C
MNTTVGQLNFFHWVIEDEVLDYLEEHYDEVQKDMDECSMTIKPNDSGRRKRHELSRSATKAICHASTPVSVSFD